MNFPNKLKFSFSVIFASVLIFTGMSILYLDKINDNSGEITANWLPSTVHLNHLNTLTSDFRIAELQHILSRTDEQMRVYETQMARISSDIRGEMARYEKLITTDVERDLYGNFLTKWELYLTESRRVLQLSRQNMNDEAKTLIRENSQILFDQYSGLLLELVKENKSWADRRHGESEKLFSMSRIILGLISIFTTLMMYRTLTFVAAKYNAILLATCKSMKENYII